jgi:hypothetical protein
MDIFVDVANPDCDKSKSINPPHMVSISTTGWLPFSEINDFKLPGLVDYSTTGRALQHDNYYDNWYVDIWIDKAVGKAVHIGDKVPIDLLEGDNRLVFENVVLPMTATASKIYGIYRGFAKRCDTSFGYSDEASEREWHMHCAPSVMLDGDYKEEVGETYGAFYHASMHNPSTSEMTVEEFTDYVDFMMPSPDDILWDEYKWLFKARAHYRRGNYGEGVHQPDFFVSSAFVAELRTLAPCEQFTVRIAHRLILLEGSDLFGLVVNMLVSKPTDSPVQAVPKPTDSPVQAVPPSVF